MTLKQIPEFHRDICTDKELKNRFWYEQLRGFTTHKALIDFEVHTRLQHKAVDLSILESIILVYRQLAKKLAKDR